jgi:hypothetical protein
MEFLQIGSPFLFLPLWIHSSRIFLRLFPMITFVAAVLVGVLCGFSFSELDPVSKRKNCKKAKIPKKANFECGLFKKLD